MVLAADTRDGARSERLELASQRGRGHPLPLHPRLQRRMPEGPRSRRIDPSTPPVEHRCRPLKRPYRCSRPTSRSSGAAAPASCAHCTRRQPTRDSRSRSSRRAPSAAPAARAWCRAASTRCSARSTRSRPISATRSRAAQFLNDQELAWTLVNDAPGVIDELETQRRLSLRPRRPTGARPEALRRSELRPDGPPRPTRPGIEIMGRLRDQMFRIGARGARGLCGRSTSSSTDTASCAGLTVLDARTGELAPFSSPGSSSSPPAGRRRCTGSLRRRGRRPATESHVLPGRTRAARHGDAPVPPDRLVAGASALTGAVLEEGLARRGRAPLQRPRRAVHGARTTPIDLNARHATSSHGLPTSRSSRDAGHRRAGCCSTSLISAPTEVERRFGEMAARTQTRSVQTSPPGQSRSRRQPTSTWAASSSTSTARTPIARPPRRRRGCRRHPRREPARRKRRRRVDRVRRARRGYGRVDRAGDGASTCPIRSWSPRRSSERTRR